tara:strand:+ start:1834 stop:2112 length:279 start_codon:yes stop_codon:yes gene_type:complete
MESNKLIAEFMGWKPNEHHWCLNGDKDLQYHTSWDWLMPVIKNIRKCINEDMSFAKYDDWRRNLKKIDPYDYNREQCYNQVVAFIKWYNKKQ